MIGAKNAFLNNGVGNMSRSVVLEAVKGSSCADIRSPEGSVSKNATDVCS